MAVSVWLENRVRAVSTNGLNSGGDNVRKSQGAKFRKSQTGNLCAVVVTVFIAVPSGIMGLLQVVWNADDEDLRLMEVPGNVMSGSLNNIAVAGSVLGTINPEFAPNPELNAEITTAPVKPAVNTDTSAATA